MRQPTAGHPQSTGTVSSGQGPDYGPQTATLVTQAELKSYQIQDLAEQIDEIMKAAVGHVLKFYLRVELTGSTPPTGETITKLNRLLKEIGKDFELK
jgi:hypothetical protein